jgi:hypothetical protein
VMDGEQALAYVSDGSKEEGEIAIAPAGRLSGMDLGDQGPENPFYGW